MNYSDKLNGYWEEGYHYYIEIKDNEIITRDYRKKTELKTTISYDAKQLESGERTVISTQETVLTHYVPSGKPYTVLRELAYESGELKLLYYCTMNMEETTYTLKKVDHGPFDNIIIRDDEYLDFLQGEWVEWSEDKTESILTINGNKLSWRRGGAQNVGFHVISEKNFPDTVEIVPEDLTEHSFSGFGAINVLPDMLTTFLQVFDMSMPKTVFARADMLDKITIPEDAKTKPQNIMMMSPNMMSGQPNGLLMNISAPPVMNISAPPVMNASAPLNSSTQKISHPKFCPECGHKIETEPAKFCANCGNKL